MAPTGPTKLPRVSSNDGRSSNGRSSKDAAPSLFPVRDDECDMLVLDAPDGLQMRHSAPGGPGALPYPGLGLRSQASIELEDRVRVGNLFPASSSPHAGGAAKTARNSSLQRFSSVAIRDAHAAVNRSQLARQRSDNKFAAAAPKLARSASTSGVGARLAPLRGSVDAATASAGGANVPMAQAAPPAGPGATGAGSFYPARGVSLAWLKAVLQALPLDQRDSATPSEAFTHGLLLARGVASAPDGLPAAAGANITLTPPAAMPALDMRAHELYVAVAPAMTFAQLVTLLEAYASERPAEEIFVYLEAFAACLIAPTSVSAAASERVAACRVAAKRARATLMCMGSDTASLLQSLQAAGGGTAASTQQQASPASHSLTQQSLPSPVLPAQAQGQGPLYFWLAEACLALQHKGPDALQPLLTPGADLAAVLAALTALGPRLPGVEHYRKAGAAAGRSLQSLLGADPRGAVRSLALALAMAPLDTALPDLRALRGRCEGSKWDWMALEQWLTLPTATPHTDAGTAMATRFLLLVGPSGAGKSSAMAAITALLSDAAQQAAMFPGRKAAMFPPPAAAAAHMFSAYDMRRSGGLAAVRALAYQLGAALPAVASALLAAPRPPRLASSVAAAAGLEAAVRELLVEPLKAAGEPPVVLALDGMDEVAPELQAETQELLTLLMSGLPPSVRLIITASPHHGVASASPAAAAPLAPHLTRALGNAVNAATTLRPEQLRGSEEALLPLLVRQLSGSVAAPGLAARPMLSHSRGSMLQLQLLVGTVERRARQVALAGGRSPAPTSLAASNGAGLRLGNSLLPLSPQAPKGGLAAAAATSSYNTTSSSKLALGEVLPLLTWETSAAYHALLSEGAARAAESGSSAGTMFRLLLAAVCAAREPLDLQLLAAAGLPPATVRALMEGPLSGLILSRCGKLVPVHASLLSWLNESPAGATVTAGSAAGHALLARGSMALLATLGLGGMGKATVSSASNISSATPALRYALRHALHHCLAARRLLSRASGAATALASGMDEQQQGPSVLPAVLCDLNYWAAVFGQGDGPACVSEVTQAAAELAPLMEGEDVPGADELPELLQWLLQCTIEQPVPDSAMALAAAASAPHAPPAVRALAAAQLPPPPPLPADTAATAATAVPEFKAVPPSGPAPARTGRPQQQAAATRADLLPVPGADQLVQAVVAYGPGLLALAAYGGRDVDLYDTTAWKRVAALRLAGSSAAVINAMTFAPTHGSSASTLAVVTSDGRVQLWQQGQAQQWSMAHSVKLNAYAHAVAFSANGRFMAVGTDAYTTQVYVLAAAGAKPRLVSEAHCSGMATACAWVEASAAAPALPALLTADTEGNVRLWRLAGAESGAGVGCDVGSVLRNLYEFRDSIVLAACASSGGVSALAVAQAEGVAYAAAWSVYRGSAGVRLLRLQPSIAAYGPMVAARIITASQSVAAGEGLMLGAALSAGGLVTLTASGAAKAWPLTGDQAQQLAGLEAAAGGGVAGVVGSPAGMGMGLALMAPAAAAGAAAAGSAMMSLAVQQAGMGIKVLTLP